MKGKLSALILIILFLMSSFNVIGISLDSKIQIEDKENYCDICADSQNKYNFNYKIITPNGHGLGLIYSNEGYSSQNDNYLESTLETQFDWRNYNNGDWTTPIKDQGSCGSCWAFATLACLEAKIKIEKNNSNYEINGREIDLSEQLMVSCCFNCYYKGNNPGLRGCWGATFDETFDFIKKEGAVTESDFVYNSYYDEDERTYIYPYCGEKNKYWKDNKYEITGWDKIEGNDELLKQKLVENGPLATTMIIYESFDDYRSGVYEPDPREDPYLLYDLNGNGYFAGHMVTIVGYDDNLECWIVKNSWGTGWGENGWFRIKYGECGINRFIQNIYGGSNYYSNTAYFTGIKTDPTEIENNEEEINYIGSYPYDLGEVLEGEISTGSITIENTGDEELRWRIYFTPASWCKWHKFTPDEGYIQPGDSQEVTIEMAPYSNYAGETVKESINFENIADGCVDYEDVPIVLKVKRKSKKIFTNSIVFEKIFGDFLNKISFFIK